MPFEHSWAALSKHGTSSAVTCEHKPCPCAAMARVVANSISKEWARFDICCEMLTLVSICLCIGLEGWVGLGDRESRAAHERGLTAQAEVLDWRWGRQRARRLQGDLAGLQAHERTNLQTYKLTNFTDLQTYKLTNFVDVHRVRLSVSLQTL